MFFIGVDSKQVSTDLVLQSVEMGDRHGLLGAFGRHGSLRNEASWL
jgi:hypothetical protein